MEAKRWGEDRNTRMKREKKALLNTSALHFSPLTGITPDQLDSMETGNKTPIYVKVLC